MIGGFLLGGMWGVGWLGENGPPRSSSELRHPEPHIPGLLCCKSADSRGARDPGGKCDVIGNMSSTAWYAAVRGLPCCQDLSDRILIHHSTLSHSRYGRSMSLAKCILSQNVRRVRVCKRHFLPARDQKAPGSCACRILGRVFRRLVLAKLWS